MSDVEELRKEIEKIKERNKRVEKEKTWETSLFRKVSIALVTYVFMVLLMSFLAIERPFLSAVVPAIGYLLSTLSISVIKNMWMNH